jgi:hypothetical protein
VADLVVAELVVVADLTLGGVVLEAALWSSSSSWSRWPASQLARGGGVTDLVVAELLVLAVGGGPVSLASVGCGHVGAARATTQVR